MTESKFIDLTCCRCGGQLKLENDNTYQCKSCGKTFEKQIAIDVADQLRIQFDEQKQEAVANLRRQLWAEMHETYINSEKIVGLARELKNYLPDDYFANFCEVANNGNDRQINKFLYETTQEEMADYADVVLNFMIMSLRSANTTAVSSFIERAFKDDSTSKQKYITRFEEEAQNVSQGIYELNLTRDVFLAYSSKDIEKVTELCDFLERNRISCFLALRNLRHGRGAADNYDKALKKAIDHCRTVVFVSSRNSRDFDCEALSKELPYIMQKDIEGAPAEYKRAYDRMPDEYMMPRVEYLIEGYCGNVAEDNVKEFFHNLEWCLDIKSVADRIRKYKTQSRETTAQRAERENRELQLKLAELEKQAEEAKKARIEAEQLATAQRQTAPVTGGIIKNDFKYCKKCHTPNKANAKFCSNCKNDKFYVNYDEYVANALKYCAKCGAENFKEDKYCVECGHEEFVPTKKAYEKLVAQREEEERQRKIREEEERKRKEEEERRRLELERLRHEEEERQRKIREEEERKRKEEEECQRKIREEEERKRKEEEERIRLEEERKRKEEEERQRILREEKERLFRIEAEAKAKAEYEQRVWKEKVHKELMRASSLIETGEFDEAEKQLNATEEGIIKDHGFNDIGDTYYYRIFLEYKERTKNSLVENLVKNKIDITTNKNYIMAKNYAEGEMSEKVNAIVTGIENYKDLERQRIEEAKREAERIIERKQERRQGKIKVAAKVAEIIFLISSFVVFAGLFVFAILANINFEDVNWTGYLMLVSVYNMFMLPANLFAAYFDKNKENEACAGIAVTSYLITLLGMIPIIVLLFLKSYAIWGWILALTFLISNLIPEIYCKFKGIKDTIDVSFMQVAIISVIIFIIATVVVSVRGWGLYF